MAASTLRITEVSEGGSAFLRAENVGRKPVLMDGEELVGGKQNRIVNASIIILQGEAIDIPGVLHGGGQVELQPADFQGRARRCSGPGRGRCRRRASQAWMRKEATAATRARSGVK